MLQFHLFVENMIISHANNNSSNGCLLPFLSLYSLSSALNVILCNSIVLLSNVTIIPLKLFGNFVIDDDNKPNNAGPDNDKY